MNKFFPVILGLMIGVGISTSLLYTDHNNVAWGGDEDAGWWNKFVAVSDNDLFDWRTVFNPLNPDEEGQGLYNLMFKKITRDSTKDALKDVAKNNGMTTDQAREVLNGSMIPIYNSARHPTMSQADAAKVMTKMQENFGKLVDLYQIKNDVDTQIVPSEIFSNGDLNDSGFDLIYDLSLIEDVLFLKKEPVTIGGVYQDAYKSPNNPTADDKTLENAYVPNESAVAFLPLTVSDKIPDEKDKEGKEKAPIKVGTFNLSEDKNVEAEIMDKDICDEGDGLSKALNSYKEKNPEDSENAGDNVKGNDAGGGSGGGKNLIDPKTGKKKDDEASGGATPNPQITPAVPADKWTKEWCANVDEPGNFAGIGSSGFDSLGGAQNNYIYGGSVSSNYSSEAVSMKASVCFDIKMIPKVLSSYMQGQSCVLCEIEKINEYLKKTLTHSFTPNKATGNLMESGKCKKSAMMPLFNIQFIAIFNPIPTPTNDKLIFGRNIFEEWNKFAKDYKPVLLNQLNFDSADEEYLSDEFNIELQKQISSANQSQADLANKIRDIKAKAATEASLKVDNADILNDVANSMVYSQTVLQEIKQMNALFKNFKDTFVKTNSKNQETSQKSDVK